MTPNASRFFAPVALALVAVLTGLGIARGEWFWPGLAGVVAGAALFVRASPWPVVPTILLSLLFGYIVGNRGFAQLSPSRSLPLFPAEAGLAVSLVLMAWEAARARNVTLGLNGLGGWIVAWIAFGTFRLVPDLQHSGLLALRDYAMVYYASFFFVARFAAQQVDLRDLFRKCLLVSTLVLLPLYALFMTFPDFFLQTLTVRGVPLIYYKGDLAGTFFAVGALAWYFEFERTGRTWPALPVALAQVATVVSTHNRASLLALAVVVAILSLRGHLRLLRTLVLGAVVAGIALTLWVETGKARWDDTPLPGLADRLASMIDLEGRSNTADESKGDNNRFRAVWWRTVFDDTVAANPWVGLGFGADLATHFLQTYYPDATDEFTARSPHCFPLTLFARTGLLGLGLFLMTPALLLRRLWNTLRTANPFATALPLCAALAVFVSACLGVVLEGPMGAVLFWTALGIAWTPVPEEPELIASNLQRSLDMEARAT